jgi:hypothetical protein
MSKERKQAKQFLKRAIRNGEFLHPFLVSLYAPISLYSLNLGEVKAQEIYRSLFLSLLLAGLTTLIMSLLFRSRAKGALLSSLLLVLFFSYGHFYNYARHIQIGGLDIGRHRYLIPTWIFLTFIFLWLIGFRIRNLSRMNSIAAAFSVILVVIPLISILTFHIQASSLQALPLNIPTDAFDELQAIPEDEMPDIYYIITDGYARWDVLEKTYHYDNSAFHEFLTERGFYVADQSESNYMFTSHSLSSSLNMNYVADIVPEGAAGPEYIFGVLLSDLIHKSAVQTLLAELGYKSVGFATGYGKTELFDADYVFTPEMGQMDQMSIRVGINSFESMLIENSAFKILLDIENLKTTTAYEYINARMQLPFFVQREMILSIFDNVKTISGIDEPKFVFIHLLSPHPPYKFGPDGGPLEHNTSFSLDENDDRDVANTIKLYTDELTYLNTRLEETIDYLFENSTRSVIIILQSDHGNHPSFEGPDRTEREVRDRIKILNAYYVPEVCKRQLYPEISPVNSFRVLFNCLFGTQFELLNDQTFAGYDIFIPIEDYIKGLSEDK